MAKGGVLSQGSAIVGEAGPEILTMMGGRAVVQPLTSSTTNTTNMGGIYVFVYGAPGQSINDLATAVAQKIEHMTQRRAEVFR